jgi:GH24 family phage-related lysozyme (muramidase)
MEGAQMKENLYKQLCIDEGVKYEIYLDHLGYPTFGIGHLITKDDEEYGLPVGTPISKERVEEVFAKDVEIASSECVKLYGNKFLMWPDEVQEILINMMFNLGRPRLSKFKNFKKALDNKDWKQAAIEGRDSLWWRVQVRNRAERLMSRLENIS